MYSDWICYRTCFVLFCFWVFPVHECTWTSPGVTSLCRVPTSSLYVPRSRPADFTRRWRLVLCSSPRIFRVLSYSAGTSERDPPLAPVTAQPALISHHITPWDEGKQAFSVTLPCTTDGGVLHGEGKRETAETREAHQQQNPFRSSLCVRLIRAFSSTSLTHVESTQRRTRFFNFNMQWGRKKMVWSDLFDVPIWNICRRVCDATAFPVSPKSPCGTMKNGGKPMAATPEFLQVCLKSQHLKSMKNSNYGFWEVEMEDWYHGVSLELLSPPTCQNRFWIHGNGLRTNTHMPYIVQISGNNDVEVKHTVHREL